VLSGFAAAAVLALAVTAVSATRHDSRSAAAGALESTVTLSPVADTYVARAAPRQLNGRSTKLVAGNNPKDRKVAYLRFQIPATVAGTLVGARLVLTRDDHHLSGTVTVSAAGSALWTEAATTARTAPKVGGRLDSVATGRTTKTISLNVAPAVHLGTSVTLAVSSSAVADVARFQSREAGAAGPKLLLQVQPVTVVTTTPPVEPTVSTPAPTTAPSSAGATTTPVSSDPGTSNPSTTSAAPSTSAPGATPTSSCTVSAKLVPSCGYWWGMSPRRFTTTSLTDGLAQDEAAAGTPFTLVHDYHVNDQLFPTPAEKALAMEPGKNRVLLLNWKPATDMTWAKVAAGGADARIDKLAAYMKTAFPYPFFLTLWHEPENDVIATAGSGMTAVDYAAMFRHVALRLRADGATMPVITMTYMGFDNWAQQSWFNQLWPGDDVVDWIGLDPYGSGDATGYMAGDFSKLVNRTSGSFAGYYSWATQQHPGKPIMLAEWGIYESPGNATGKASFFDSVISEIGKFPDVKALVYFDKNLPGTAHGGDTSPDSSSASLAGFQRLARFSTASGIKPVYIANKVAARG
jgi:hypothetical protein